MELLRRKKNIAHMVDRNIPGFCCCLLHYEPAFLKTNIFLIPGIAQIASSKPPALSGYNPVAALFFK